MMKTGADLECVAPVLVLGVGNRLLGDDGVGPALADRLRIRHAGESRVEIVDGGTQGLALLGLFENRRAVLLLDAIAVGADAGHVHVIEDPLQEAMARGQSAHEDNVSDLLRVVDLLGHLPASLALVGVEPGVIETRLGLSQAVTRSLPEAMATAERLLERMLGTLESFQRGELPCTK